MRSLSIIQKTVLTAVAVAALAGARPSLAASPVATLTMTDQGVVPAIFIPDGVKAFVSGTIGAQVQLLDDGTFTISCRTMPPIVGRWSTNTNQSGSVTCFWAKTDEIDFNGTVVGADQAGNPIVLYSVQVNAPRTDGSGGSGGGRMTPASFQLVQLWTLASGSGGGIGSGGVGSGGGAKR